jgi:hypothetical protein
LISCGRGAISSPSPCIGTSTPASPWGVIKGHTKSIQYLMMHKTGQFLHLLWESGWIHCFLGFAERQKCPSWDGHTNQIRCPWWMCMSLRISAVWCTKLHAKGQEHTKHCETHAQLTTELSAKGHTLSSRSFCWRTTNVPARSPKSWQYTPVVTLWQGLPVPHPGHHTEEWGQAPGSQQPHDWQGFLPLWYLIHHI